MILTVDATAPGAPAISTITNGVTQVTGTVANGGFTNDTTPTLTGTAEANSTVMIFDGATPLGTATADGTGAWTFTTVALPEGGHSFTATATDAAGNIGPPSAAYGMIIDITAPVVTVGLANDTGSSSSDKLTSDDTLTGSASANAVVTLTEGANTLGTATADGTGHWTFTPPGLANGSHTIVATETDAAGNTGSASLSFVLDTQHATVLSVAINDLHLTVFDAGLTRSATITFSEAMDQTVAPTVTNNASSTLTNPSGSWLDATHYVVSYTVADANVTLGNITFDVSGGKDLAGNTQSAATGVGSGTDVDTRNIAWSIAGGGNVTEGGAPSFTVSYTGATLAEGNTVSITLAFGAGATEGADFPDSFLQDIDDAIAALPGSGITRAGSVLTFSNPAVTSLTFTLPTVNDTLIEGNEAFSVSINTPNQGSVVAPTANASIIDNDAANIVWLITGGGNVIEGGSPSFTVGYTGATLAENNTLSINLAFGAGATEPQDFIEGFLKDVADAIALLPGTAGISLNGSILTFSNPAVTSLTFTLPTFNDALIEGNEAFSVSINTPSDGTIGVSTANSSIIDNDAANIVWLITGGGNVIEGGSPSFTVGYTGATLAENNTLSINLAFGAGATEPQDFIEGFLKDVADAIALLPGTAGISLNGSILTFSNPAVTSLTFTLPTFNDALIEGNEAFSVSINTPSDGTIGVSTANSTIIDNDAANIVWLITGGGNVIEGGSPSFTVGYTGATLAENNTLSINLAFGAGATEPQDFIEGFLKDIADAIALLPGTAGISLNGSILTFSNPAVTSLTFTLPTFNDTLIEGNEAFSVSINTPSDGTIGVSTANSTIIDNDAANIVWLITGGGNVIEGGSPSFTVGYTGATLAENNTLSINLAFGAGATEPQDFIEGFLKDVADAIALLPGTAGISLNGSILTFSNPAVTSLTFTLPTFNDALIEGNEAFSVSINTPSDGTIGVSTANSTIIDNDAANIVWLITGGGNVIEGGSPSFTVGYTGATLAENNTLSINLAFGAGATEPQDFIEGFLKDVADAIALLPGTAGISLNGSILTFSNPAVTSLTFTLPTFNDALIEGNEAFSVSINTPSDGTIGVSTANSTIIDNDAANIVWLITGGGNVIEGGSPSFTVGYTGATLAENNTLSINLAFGAGATEPQDFIEGFLKDVADAIALLPGTAGISLNGSILTFSNPAVTSLTFTLPTFNDALIEGNEAFSVSINTPSDGTIGVSTANSTIIDNDAANIVWLITGGGNVIEGGSPSFTVGYTGATLAENNTLSINLAFGAGATEPQDFIEGFLKDVADAIALLPGTAGISLNGSILTFSNPAVTSLTFTLPTFNDALIEGNEAFSVSINTPSDGTIGVSTANSTIIDNDAANIVWLITGGGNVIEGGSPSFTVGYTGATLAENNTLSINLAFGAGATEPQDFIEGFLKDVADAIALLPGTAGISLNGSILTFSNPAVTSLTFTLPTFNDALIEGNEAFSVSINTPSDGTIGVSTANSTIIDNDAANIVWLITGGGNVIEGGSPSFTVGYTGATLAENNTLSINLAFGAGATEPQDFIEGFLKDVADAIALLPGTAGISLNGSILTFSNPAVTSLTFTLPTFNDALIEGNEAFSVSINTPSDGTIGVSMANSTIIDNDPTAGAPIILEVDEAALSTGSNPSLTTEVDNSPTLSFTAAGFNLNTFAFSTDLSGLIANTDGVAGNELSLGVGGNTDNRAISEFQMQVRPRSP